MDRPYVSEPRQTFWVIKHGLKMTGMPAWGSSHGDDEPWAIVAFVGKLPGMTPSQYQKMVGSRAMESGTHGESTEKPTSSPLPANRRK